MGQLLTNQDRDNGHDQKVEVGNPSKLLQQVLRQEHDKGVFRRFDHIRFGLVQALVVNIASDWYREGVIEHSHSVPLE